MRIQWFIAGIVVMGFLKSDLNSQEDHNRILSAKKIYDTNSKYWDEFSEKCTQWNLTKQDMVNILLSSLKVNGHEAHYYYENLPCSYRGELIINKKKARFIINAGALSEIKFNDTTIFYGYKKNDFKRYFILGPGMD